MAEKNLKARIVHKHDVEANWLLATNFTPLKGELIVYDIDETHPYERIKIGDGVQNVNNLPFYNDGFVSYNEQELTDEQKQQAQTNIGIEIASDDEIIELLMQEDMFPVVQDSDGSLLADENDNILLW